jgi:hypothetical protein
MAGFRRPELEKDNPIAPQMYVGPRRRRLLARAAASTQVTAQERMTEVMQSLMEAAERFVASVPPGKKLTQERKALLRAIVRTQQHLANEAVRHAL